MINKFIAEFNCGAVPSMEFDIPNGTLDHALQVANGFVGSLSIAHSRSLYVSKVSLAGSDKCIVPFPPSFWNEGIGNVHFV